MPDSATISPTELLAERQALGLSQQQLADELDVAKATISRWERGVLTIERPRMLRRALEGIAHRQREA